MVVTVHVVQYTRLKEICDIHLYIKTRLILTVVKAKHPHQMFTRQMYTPQMFTRKMYTRKMYTRI